MVTDYSLSLRASLLLQHCPFLQLLLVTRVWMTNKQASSITFRPLGSKHDLPEIFNFVRDVANNKATVLGTPKSAGRETAKGET